MQTAIPKMFPNTIFVMILQQTSLNGSNDAPKRMHLAFKHTKKLWLAYLLVEKCTLEDLLLLDKMLPDKMLRYTQMLGSRLA